MKTLNLTVGVAALMIGFCWPVLYVAAANNPLGGFSCTATTDACNAFAREAARQDFVNGFLGYSIFTTVSIIVLFLRRTKQNKSSITSSKRVEKSVRLLKNP